MSDPRDPLNPVSAQVPGGQLLPGGPPGGARSEDGAGRPEDGAGRLSPPPAVRGTRKVPAAAGRERAAVQAAVEPPGEGAQGAETGPRHAQGVA